MLERGKEFVVTALPLYHVFALTVNCLLFMRIGGYNLLISNPRDIPGFVKEIRSTPSPVLPGSTPCSMRWSTMKSFRDCL